MKPPRCFISYSWDSEEHRDWVRKLATGMRQGGVGARLDQFHCAPGMDLTQFMEESIRESNFVLLVCTPNFARKADAKVGGVGYEKQIITGEIFSAEAREIKFVPVLREGDANESLPSYLKSRLFVDFRDDGSFETKLDELLRHFYDVEDFAQSYNSPLNVTQSDERPAPEPDERTLTLFISYRRSDSAFAAHQIFDALSESFGREALVFDVDTIPLGVDFKAYIEEQVSRCDVLLAVIGDRWLDSTLQRQHENNDFVRLEIQAALARGIPVVPVLLGDVAMPKAEILPESIAALADRNAAKVMPGKLLKAHLNELVEGLNAIVKATRFHDV